MVWDALSVNGIYPGSFEHSDSSKSKSMEPPIYTDGRRFIQEGDHLDTMRTLLARRLSGRIVEDSLAVCVRNTGVHQRPSAVAEGFGFEHVQVPR
jgi:hypothetical protein